MSVVPWVGLGYVGLPLAVEFGKIPHHRLRLVKRRCASYRRHVDPTGEISSEELKAAAQLARDL